MPESWGKVSVLASCETAEDIQAAEARGYAIALVVEEFPTERRYALADSGRGVSSLGMPRPEVLPCPAQTRGVPCSDCQLCFDDGALRERGYAIGFEIHGIPYAKRQARIALERPDDPLRRMPSEERIRIIRERYLEQGREPTVKELSEELDLNPSSVWEWLRFLRGEIPHPSERRRQARQRKKEAAA